MIKILYAVAIIIGFASTAYAIKCHVCISANKSSDCADTFKVENKYAFDCDNPLKLLSTFLPNLNVATPKATGCLKYKVESNGEIYTNRACYFADLSKSKEYCHQSEMAAQGNSKQLSCDVCTDDLCNSSTTTGIFAATVMCLAVIVRMMS